MKRRYRGREFDDQENPIEAVAKIIADEMGPFVHRLSLNIREALQRARIEEADTPLIVPAKR